MDTITRTGVPSGLIILGLIFLIFGALMMFNNLKEAGFTPTAGQIISSDIVKRTETRSTETTSSISWYLAVEYSYSVDGQSYKSDNISSEVPMSDAARGQSPSKKLVALSERFVPGEAITVYVSPRNPKKSILLHAPNYGIWGVLIGFLFFAGAFWWARARSGQ